MAGTITDQDFVCAALALQTGLIERDVAVQAALRIDLDDSRSPGEGLLRKRGCGIDEIRSADDEHGPGCFGRTERLPQDRVVHIEGRDDAQPGGVEHPHGPSQPECQIDPQRRQRMLRAEVVRDEGVVPDDGHGRTHEKRTYAE